jgi:hypothetical protein
MTQATGVTHTRYVRGAVFKNEELQALFFTGMTDCELFDLKCDMGLRWLVVWFKTNGLSEAAANDWWAETEVKQVWNLHWRKIDHDWVVQNLHKVMPSERENYYRDMHCRVFEPENTYYTFLEMAMYRVMRRIDKNLLTKISRQ